MDNIRDKVRGGQRELRGTMEIAVCASLEGTRDLGQWNLGKGK